jgi:hypothetical protein
LRARYEVLHHRQAGEVLVVISISGSLGIRTFRDASYPLGLRKIAEPRRAPLLGRDLRKLG